MNKSEDKEWEKEVPFLAALPKGNPFTVPDQYFELLNDRMQSEASIQAFTTNTPASGFTVPANYFTELTASILHTTTNAQLLPTKETGFTLPEGYFEQLHTRILNSTTGAAKKETKIVRLWHSDLMKYASAACVILMTAAALFLNQQQETSKQIKTAELYGEEMLFDIDEQAIIEHVNPSQKIHQVNVASSAQLESYILDNYSSKEIALEF